MTEEKKQRKIFVDDEQLKLLIEWHESHLLRSLFLMSPSVIYLTEATIIVLKELQQLREQTKLRK